MRRFAALLLARLTEPSDCFALERRHLAAASHEGSPSAALGAEAALRDPLAAVPRDPTPALQGCYGIDCVERYCAFVDGAYSWHSSGAPVAGATHGVGWTSFPLGLRSQAWMVQASGVSGWDHRLTVVVPDALSADSVQAGWAMLLVNEAPELAQAFAARTGMLVATLSDTPPTFMKLSAAGPPEFEEVAKAHSWVKFARHPEQPEWPIEMPTVKAVVRAMDAVSEFVTSPKAANPATSKTPPAVTSFIVSGWSKRAIATYMAGAVDPRVKVIIPISHPVDLDAVGRASYRNLGETTDAAKVYDAARVFAISGDKFDRLDAIIDPVNYLDRLTMPTLLMLGGQDIYFPPDCTRSWWQEKMPSPKTLYLHGNTGHDGFVDPFVEDGAAFVNMIVHNESVPAIDYEIQNATGDIVVRLLSDHRPSTVKVWWAVTPTARTRDFRSARYLDRGLVAAPQADERTWVAHADSPEDGRWLAFFVELEYAVLGGTDTFKLTTEASVVPDKRPYRLALGRANYLT